MHRKGYIYRHWIVINNIEVSYIGQTVQKPEARWGKNGNGYTQKKKKTQKRTAFGQAIIDYGWDNFHHDIIGIVEADTEEKLIDDLNEWEKYYIWKYDSLHHGFNSKDGGSTVVGESNPMYGTTYEKAPRARAVVCINTGEKFGTAKQAAEWCGTDGGTGITKCCKNKLVFVGRHPETGEKLQWCYYEDYINNNYTKVNEKEYTENRYKKSSKTLKETLAKPEVKEKRSASKKGERNPMFGKESGNAKKVMCLNTGEIFSSQQKAGEWGGVTGSKIGQCCLGKKKTAGKHPITGERLRWARVE